MKTNFISLFLLPMIIIGCKNNTNQNDYLKKVLDNLEKIESATYRSTQEAWQPGDTVATSVRCTFIKEYDNPADSTIGAIFVSLECEDMTKLDFCYDGNVRILVNHDIKAIALDDFSSRPSPYRLVLPPFFNYAKNIIKYALNTTDSISTTLEDLGDHYYFKLVINEGEQVEFFGKAYHMPKNPYNLGETTSIYELWISKSNNLPYKVRSEKSSYIYVRRCSDVEINKLKINDFNVNDYIPQDYEIRKYGDKRNTKPRTDLTGKKAPDWTLNDQNEQVVSLSDFKSKVLLIDFTGIGCGPCQASIPFLKKLKDNFNTEDFELVAIESWSRNARSHQNYINKNNLNYTMLSATDAVIDNYQTGGVAPVFVILDSQRIIRKVITGYNGETTDKEIMNTITEIISASKKI